MTLPVDGQQPVTAEYQYYRTLGGGGAGQTTAPDFEEWIRILGTGKDFAPGGRYGIVSEVLGRRPKVQRLLEIGCGSGETLAYMSRWAEESVGADIYLKPHLRAPQPSRLTFIEFNANSAFPFPDEHLEAVVAMMVMEHVFDPFHFCAEAARVLRKDGLFFLNVPLVTALRHRVAVALGRVPKTSRADWFEKRAWDGGHLHYFSLPLLRQLLECSGFRVTMVRCPGRGHRIKQIRPTLLAAEISILAQRQ